jgi:hypothetical protein
MRLIRKKHVEPGPVTGKKEEENPGLSLLKYSQLLLPKARAGAAS